ncbi:MAG TPA: hypothetical protein VIY48_15970 [Candidatus Paceibacterota bacterium]
MATTPIVAGMNTLKTPFADVAANELNIAWQTGTVGGETFACTGREILLIRNDSGTNTVTITSVANAKGRSENLAAYEITGTEIAVWTGGLTNEKGWKQTDGTIIVTATTGTAVSFAVLRLPARYP